MSQPFRTAPMKDGIRYDDKGRPVSPDTRDPVTPLTAGQTECDRCHGTEWIDNGCGVVPCPECSVSASTYRTLLDAASQSDGAEAICGYARNDLYCGLPLGHLTAHRDRREQPAALQAAPVSKPCSYCGSINGETPFGTVQPEPLTGETLRMAIASATPLTNPRLSEVEWDDVAALTGVNEPQAAPVSIDPARLAEAMSDAYTYEDRDNSVPTLPFYDDNEAFWDPFAAKVAEGLSHAE